MILHPSPGLRPSPHRDIGHAKTTETYVDGLDVTQDLSLESPFVRRVRDAGISAARLAQLPGSQSRSGALDPD